MRIGLTLFLLAVVFSLLVWGGIDRRPAPELGVYPGAEEIAEQPGQYQEQQVGFTAQVTSTDPVIVRADYETNGAIKSIRLEITDLETAIDSGDRLQIFGPLIDSQTVRAENIVVVPQSGRWYAWVISFIAGLWVLGRLLRDWTIDITTGAVHPRAEPLRPFDWGDD